MSSGPVKCSLCNKPLKQSGPRTIEDGWRHADDSARCESATTEWAREMTEAEYNKAMGYSSWSWPVARTGGAGNSRNGPCRCGSGKKTKRCCGVEI